MISATGRRSRQGRKRVGGFSLLEMLIVLGIIALFTGFFALRFDDGHVEETLARVSGELRKSALLAKRRSFAYRRDQFVVLSKQSFELSGRHGSDFGRPSDSEAGEPGERFVVPSDVTMEWQVPGSKTWQRDPDYVWTFRGSGLSDPLVVRFSLKSSYTELSFNVLTGTADEVTIIE